MAKTEYKHLEIPGNFERFVKDKRQSANAYYRYFLARLSRMFEYKNLPDTIPHEILDRYLMNNGIACITEVDGKLYVFYGNLGGPQDVYYRPTEFIISNPHVKTSDGQLFTANIPIFTKYQESTEVPMAQLGQPKGVLIRNDTEWFGLAPMLSRYAYLMAENALTLRTADVMLRVVAMITAPSGKERVAAEEYIKALEKGELKVIGESAFFDGVKLQSPPSNNGSYLTQFIEYQQYLKGSFYNEVGLSANYNMKREAIGKGESTLDEDALLPLCDDMLLCRKQDLALVNEMFGTDIEVSFSSAWLENELEALSTISQFGSGSTPFDQPFTQSSGSTHVPTGDSGDGQDDTSGSTQETPDAVGGGNGAKGAEETKEDNDEKENDGVGTVLSNDESSQDESTENSGSSESENNDVGWSETLQVAKENLENKIEKGDEANVSMGNSSTENNSGNNSADERDIQSHELQLQSGSKQDDT